MRSSLDREMESSVVVDVLDELEVELELPDVDGCQDGRWIHDRERDPIEFENYD